MRYVLRDRRIYDFSRCTCCGTCWGGYPDRKCPVTTCLACGTAQCFGNGLGNGCCRVCLIGFLPGWAGTDQPCGYAECTQRAVGRGKRNKFVCEFHLTKQGFKLDEVLAHRNKDWVRIEE